MLDQGRADPAGAPADHLGRQLGAAVDGNEVPTRHFPNGLEAVTKHFGLFAAVKSIKGPLSARRTLGASQSVLGKWLGFYRKEKRRGEPFQKTTLSLWERVERGTRQPIKYAMTDSGRAAYRSLLMAVVELAGGGRYRLVVHMGPRRWRLALEANCSNCGKPYRLSRAGQVRCRRCIGKAKR